MPVAVLLHNCDKEELRCDIDQEQLERELQPVQQPSSR